MKRKKLSKTERIEIHRKTGGHCAYCGIEIDVSDMQVDHIFPISQGGLDEKENMLLDLSYRLSEEIKDRKSQVYGLMYDEIKEL